MSKLARSAMVIGLMLILAGCRAPRELSAEEFMALHARNAETMRHSEFMGVQNGKAVLKVSTMSLVNRQKWKTSYFVTDVEKLPEGWTEKNSPDPRH